MAAMPAALPLRYGGSKLGLIMLRKYKWTLAKWCQWCKYVRLARDFGTRGVYSTPQGTAPDTRRSPPDHTHKPAASNSLPMYKKRGAVLTNRAPHSHLSHHTALRAYMVTGPNSNELAYPGASFAAPAASFCADPARRVLR